jgi:hypothetical protein
MGGPNRLLVRANEHLNAQSPASPTAALHYIHSMLRSVLCVKIIYIYIFMSAYSGETSSMLVPYLELLVPYKSGC